MSYRKTIGITGASGALGKALTRKFKSNGYEIIGLTHNKNNNKISDEGPNKWIYWECGKEFLLEKALLEIDILILNHGIYGSINQDNLENTLTINAISKLKILRLFEKIAFKNANESSQREIWINTSEAEIFPALNPSYEISKSLIGQSISFRKNFLTRDESKKLLIKKIILGPFKSELNPIGILSPTFVANLIYYISKLNTFLIIVSPNPLTYIFFPIQEFYFSIYHSFMKYLNKSD
tara:strand:- start:1519 stop:2232 length:714 start_codon:yes stop_codon:yes gene_type:complete